MKPWRSPTENLAETMISSLTPRSSILTIQHRNFRIIYFHYNPKPGKIQKVTSASSFPFEDALHPVENFEIRPALVADGGRLFAKEEIFLLELGAIKAR